MNATDDLAGLKTIDQIISRAREITESLLYGWAAAGAGQEVTTARNAIALNSLALVPGMLNDFSDVGTRRCRGPKPSRSKVRCRVRPGPLCRRSRL